MNDYHQTFSALLVDISVGSMIWDLTMHEPIA